MQHHSKSNSVMESDTIQKNGDSPKILMSRRILKKSILYLMFVSGICFTQSCAMLTVRGHHAMLNHSSAYSAADIQITSPIFSSNTNIEFNLGVGKMDFSNADIEFADADNASSIAPLLGVGVTHYFTKKRLQPFAGAEANMIFWGNGKMESEGKTKDKDNNGFTTITPKVGLRFYVSNRIALNGSLGYQYGKADIQNTSNTLHGFMPSVGITFVLSTKELK